MTATATLPPRHSIPAAAEPVVDAQLAAAREAFLEEVRFELTLIRGISEVAGDLTETIARLAFLAGVSWETARMAANLTDYALKARP